MDKIKNIEQLHGKELNSAKIEENMVVFMLETGEKITLFATESEQLPLKSNAILERYAAIDYHGKFTDLKDLPAGYITDISVKHRDDAVTFSCKLGWHSLDIRWRLLHCSRLYLAIEVE